MTSRLPFEVPDFDETDSADPGDARIIRGNPNDEEIAAIVTVLGGLFDSGVHADVPRDIVPKRTAWQRSQRAMRGGGSASDPFGGRFGRS